MSDLSTFAGQAEHYAAVRARLWGAKPAPKPIEVPPPAPVLKGKRPLWLMPAYSAPMNLNLHSTGGATTIIKLVALKHRVTHDDIVGPRRDREVVTARYEAIRLVKTHCRDLSFPAIGRIFNRDHSTILNALGRLKKNRKSTEQPTSPR